MTLNLDPFSSGFYFYFPEDAGNFETEIDRLVAQHNWEGIISLLEKKTNLTAIEAFNLYQFYRFINNNEKAASLSARMVEHIPQDAITWSCTLECLLRVTKETEKVNQVISFIQKQAKLVSFTLDLDTKICILCVKKDPMTLIALLENEPCLTLHHIFLLQTVYRMIGNYERANELYKKMNDFAPEHILTIYSNMERTEPIKDEMILPLPEPGECSTPIADPRAIEFADSVFADDPITPETT